MRIVFMGTPDFAVGSLKGLVEGGYDVVGVVTVPDKPVGRHGNTLQPSPVKQYALSAGLPVLQPEKLKDEAFIEALRQWKADLQIVVAFRMLPEVVWSMPRYGTFNLHASLLPQYRGAAPINWAIINGETQTGVTTFFIDKEIDTGRIIKQETCPVYDTDDAGTLHDRLRALGTPLVLQTVNMLIAGTIKSVSQTDSGAALKPAPKIFRETCRIDWNKSTTEVYNFIRGLSPYPAAWTSLQTPNGLTFEAKILSSSKTPEPHSLTPGTLRLDGKKCLEVATADGFINVLTLQPAGKKPMTAKAFLNGLMS
jgi:methionyl-tRNA formyltransferase